MTNKESLQRYLELTNQIQVLEEEKSTLGESIFNELKTDGLDKLQSEFGTFSLVKTAKYTFSEAVKALEDHLKKAKEEEKEKNIALVEEKETLRFQAKK